MKLLFAVDLTESEAVCRAVEQLAERMDAELLVLHVYRQAPHPPSVPVDPLTGVGDYASYSLYDPSLERNIEAAEESAYRRFLTERFQRPVQAALRAGEPAEVILEDADEEDVDLIVVGKRHHSALERLLLGSTGREVVEQTDRPILLMPLLEDLD